MKIPNYRLFTNPQIFRLWVIRTWFFDLVSDAAGSILPVLEVNLRLGRAFNSDTQTTSTSFTRVDVEISCKGHVQTCFIPVYT